MAGLRSYQPLRLMAADADDLAVVSAMLQDAVAKLGDFIHQKDRRRFAFVSNRFVWECAGDSRIGPFARVRAGCHFDDVLSVSHLNLRLDKKDAVVEILAVRFEPGADGGGAILLDLAGGGGVKIEVESVNVSLSDISEPWRTRRRPEHAE